MASLGKSQDEKPKFKSIKKKRPLRTRRDSDEEGGEDANEDKQDSESVLQVIIEILLCSLKFCLIKINRFFL